MEGDEFVIESTIRLIYGLYENGNNFGMYISEFNLSIVLMCGNVLTNRYVDI